MSKIDLKNAFCLIHICPHDWHLLSMQWKGMLYIDTFLPFSLCSAPFLFNQFSDALHWILQHNYDIRHLLHYMYLDDYFTAGTPASQECANNLSTMLAVCNNLNAPVKPSKTEGPTTHLIFLGITINTTTMTVSISEEQKQDIIHSLQSLLCKSLDKEENAQNESYYLSLASYHSHVRLYQLIESSCIGSLI